MKKTLFFLVSLCALAFVSCQKEEMAENSVTGTEYTYVFTGTNNPEVKAAVGDKDAAGWPILWEAGDQLGVFKADGTFAGTADLTAADAGKNVGEFTLNTNVELTDGETLYLTYPYVEGTTFADGKFTAAVKTAQTAAGKSVGANAVAYATAVKAEKTSFTLAHTNAYVRLVMSTEEFKDYTLVGATLWCDGEVLSGNAAVAVADGTVTATETEDYVKSTLSEGVVMGTEAKEVWMTALPADLTGKTVYAIVHMTKGIETVTLPVALTGKQLKKHAVNTIQLPALAKSLAPAWYEPVETRYIAVKGDGWSYGPENTVLFTEDGQEKTVELKARGNFMKVKQPAKVQINNVSDQNGAVADRVYINDVDGNNKTSVDLDANCSVKVKMKVNGGAGYCSSMLVQDADGKTIWGINLWLSHDGVNTAAYADGEVMDRNIGSSKVSSVKKHYTCNGVYFQWGRPFGFPWSTSNKGTSIANTDITNTLEKSAENPFVMYCYSNDGNGEGYPWDWYWGDGSNRDRSGDLDDLWGNPQSSSTDVTTSGVKSIYDPCPKGYRVASPAILYEVSSNIVAEYNSENALVSTGATEINVSSTNHHYLVYKGISWGFSGQFRPLEGAWGKAGDAKVDYLAFWSNANNNQNGYELYYQTDYTKATKKITKSNSRTKAAASPVRCMVDTENR